MKKSKSPVRPIRRIIVDKAADHSYINRLLIGTPSTGVIRMEWSMARTGLVVPVNWSHVQMVEFIDSYAPIGYSVADAQNLIIKEVVERDFEWLLLYEHDNIPPPGAFSRINKYIQSADVPVVSGLYYTKSNPAEPLIFRGRGTGAYHDFKMGDKVWCDGVPTGFLLIHAAILRAMWEESPEYMVTQKGRVTRRVFSTPVKIWANPEQTEFSTTQGTSDLEWCSRVMEEGFFAKSGWNKFQKKKYPFLVDTKMFCMHIDIGGIQYPVWAKPVG